MLRWMNRSTAGGKSRAEKIAAMVEKIAGSDLSVDEFFRRYTVPFSRPQYFRYQARLAAQGTGTSDDLGRRFRNPGRAGPASRLGRTYGRSHRALPRPFSAQRRLPPGTSRQGPQRTPGRSVHGGL